MNAFVEAFEQLFAPLDAPRRAATQPVLTEGKLVIGFERDNLFEAGARGRFDQFALGPHSRQQRHPGTAAARRPGGVKSGDKCFRVVQNTAEFGHEDGHQFGFADFPRLPRGYELVEGGDIDRAEPLVKIDQVEKMFEATVVAEVRRARVAGHQAVGLEAVLLEKLRERNRAVADTVIIAAEVKRQGRSEHAGEGETRDAAIGKIIGTIDSTGRQLVEIRRYRRTITGDAHTVIAQGIDDEQNDIGHWAPERMEHTV